MDVDIVESSAMNPPAEPIVKEKISKKGIKRDTATENSESENEKLNTFQAKKLKSTLSASKAEIIAYKATIEEQTASYCLYRSKLLPSQIDLKSWKQIFQKLFNLGQKPLQNYSHQNETMRMLFCLVACKKNATKLPE